MYKLNQFGVQLLRGSIILKSNIPMHSNRKRYLSNPILRNYSGETSHLSLFFPLSIMLLNVILTITKNEIKMSNVIMCR